LIVLGTSGFFYREWRGIFYPQGLPIGSWLSFYARNFNGLEVNSTFYRLPVKSSLRNYQKFPLNYVFKLYRGITHYRKLTEENVKPFLMVKEILKENLVCLLGQFPKSFSYSEANLEFLNAVVETFRAEGISVAVELRSPTWEGRLEKVKTAVVCSDFPENLGWMKECKETEELSYFRFHGRKALYRSSYTEEELKEIAERIKESSSRVKCVFFNNTAGGAAVENALKLKELLGL